MTTGWRARSLVLVEPSAFNSRPKASTYQADPDTRSEAVYRPETHADQCFLCGRGLTRKGLANGWWINLGTDDTLMPDGWGQSDEYDEVLDQGCFPVGSECAKRIARPYKFKSLALANLVGSLDG